MRPFKVRRDRALWAFLGLIALWAPLAACARSQTDGTATIIAGTDPPHETAPSSDAGDSAREDATVDAQAAGTTTTSEFPEVHLVSGTSVRVPLRTTGAVEGAAGYIVLGIVERAGTPFFGVDFAEAAPPPSAQLWQVSVNGRPRTRVSATSRGLLGMRIDSNTFGAQPLIEVVALDGDGQVVVRASATRFDVTSSPSG